MSETPKDLCYRDLRKKVLSTNLTPGTDLDEVETTHAYAISRTPLREVFQRLAGKGYVRLSANRGARVMPLDADDCRKSFQAAPVIMDASVRLAASQHLPGQVAVLKEASEQVRRCVERDARVQAILASHRLLMMIGYMAHNDYLNGALERLWIDLTRLTILACNHGPTTDTSLVKDVCVPLQDLVRSISAGNAEAASEKALSHLALLENAFHESMRSRPLPLRHVGPITR